MAIGANPKGSIVNSGYFKGKIYSVRLYNRALSETEVTKNYNYEKNRYSITE